MLFSLRKKILPLMALLMIGLVTGATGAVASADAAVEPIRYAPSTSNMVVNVKELPVNFPDQKPFINAQGRTMVPVRFVSEALGAKVNWISQDNKVEIRMSDREIDLWLNQRTYKLNGASATMDTEARLVSGRTMVPLRFVSEGLGYQVDYKTVNGRPTVNIYKGQAPEIPVTTDLPADFPTSREVVPLINGVRIPIETQGQYVRLLFSSVNYNRSTGNLSLMVPLAPKGMEMTVNIGYRAADGRMQGVLAGSNNVLAENTLHQWNLPPASQVQEVYVYTGLRKAGSARMPLQGRLEVLADIENLTDLALGIY